MARVRYLSRTLVQTPLRYALARSEAEYLSEMRRLRVPETQVRHWVNPLGSATTHFMENAEGEHVALVCIAPPVTATGVEVAALLVHEAVHLWQHYRRLVGEVAPSDEFEAYSIQSLAQALMLAYARNG